MRARAAASIRVAAISLLPFVLALGVLYPRITFVFASYTGPLQLTVTFRNESASATTSRVIPAPLVPFANLEMPVTAGFPNLRFDNISIDTGLRDSPAQLRQVLLSTALFQTVLETKDIGEQFDQAGTVLTGNAAFRSALRRFKADYILGSLGVAGMFALLFWIIGLIGKRSGRLRGAKLGAVGGAAALLALTLAAAALYEPFLSGRYIYAYVDVGFDTFNQYIPFLVRWKQQFDRSGIPFWPMWSFGAGPGMNIGPVLADPFHLLFLFFGFGARSLPAWLSIIAVAKVVLAGAFFYLFLSKHRISREAAALGALGYAFNSFIVIWGQHPQYASFTVYLALLLYGFELYRGGKPPVIFLLACCLFVISHFFFLLVSLPLLFLYAAARFSSRQPLFSRPVFLRLARMIPLVVLGGSLAAFYALPQLEIILSSPRAAGRWKVLDTPFFDAADHAGRLTVFIRMLANDLRGTGNDFTGKGNYYIAPALYAGLLTLFLAVQYFALTRGRSRTRFLLSFSIFSAALFSPRLRTILYALVEDFFRELCLFWMTLTIILAAHAFDRGQRLKKFSRPGAAITFAAICGIVFYGDRADVRIHVLAFAALYAALLCFFRPGRIQRAVLWSLILMPLIELPLFSLPALHDRARVPSDAEHDREGYNDVTITALRKINFRDPGSYRIDKQYNSVFFNDPLMQGYHGLTGYYSFLNRPYREFLAALGIPIVELTRRYLHSPVPNWGAMRILGVRYILALNDPFGGVEADLAETAGPVKIFRLRDSRSLAFTYRDAITENEFRALSNGEQNRVLERAAVLPEGSPLASAVSLRLPSDIFTAAWDGTNGEIAEFDDSRVSGSIETPTSALLFLSIPFDTGWRLKIDGVPVETAPVSIGFTGAPIGPGLHRFELDYIPPGFVPGLIISGAAWIIAARYLLRRSRTHSATARPNPARP